MVIQLESGRAILLCKPESEFGASVSHTLLRLGVPVPHLLFHQQVTVDETLTH